MLLQKMKWPEVKEEMEKGVIVIVPVGSTEQHGYHLPVDTDIAIPYYVAQKAAEETGDLVVPPVNYGYNEKEVDDFPGTVSVRMETLTQFLFDICRSLSRSGFKKMLLLNGHGYNVEVVRAVGHLVNERTNSVCAATEYWNFAREVLNEVRQSVCPGGNAHADEFETSMKLYLDPKNVDMSKAVKELTYYKTKYTWMDFLIPTPVSIRTKWRNYTKSGVVGDPTLATREKGEKIIKASIEGLVEFLHIFRTKIEH